MITTIPSTRSIAGIVATGLTALLLSAQVALADPAERDAPAPNTAATTDVGALYPTYFSGYTSDEYPPVTASNSYLVSAMACSGAYCDNVALGYEYLAGANHTSNYWTPYFSEEGTNYQICSGNSFMTGIACKGGYCDNITLQCTYISGKTKSGTCYWSAYFSEEQGVQYIPPGYYVDGVQCSGSNCDNKRMRYCPAV